MVVADGFGLKGSHPRLRLEVVVIRVKDKRCGHGSQTRFSSSGKQFAGYAFDSTTNG
jgi:hypothetical protein